MHNITKLFQNPTIRLQSYTGLIVLVLMLLTMTMLNLSSHTNAQDNRCFPETGYCIDGVILDYWEQNGGLAVFGFPTTELSIQTVENWTGPVQWFERDRLEDHSADNEGVLAGRLGALILEMQGQPWQSFEQVDSAPDGCRYFSETRHSLCEPFQSYWEQNGGLARFGYPITEPYQTTIGDWTGTIQYFERRRMEHHPENAGTRFEVLLGLLGNEVSELSDGTAYPTPTDSGPPVVTTASPTPDGGDTPETDPDTTSTSTPEPDATATPTPPSSAQQPAPGTCLTAAEAELAGMINVYRNEQGLPDVPFSKSLSLVAQTHVLDLQQNNPDSGTDDRGMECNMHSWSDKGTWTPVCYTDDHQNANGMWSKPGELTSYPGRGYEIAHSSSGGATPSSALDGWKGSPPHNATILETDIWANIDWGAMGIGISGNYAVVWFGEETDPAGTITACP